MFSEKDFERLWFLYKTEGEPNGVSINSFCIGNNIPYTAFYDWFKSGTCRTRLRNGYTSSYGYSAWPPRKRSGLSCPSFGLSSCGGGTDSNYPTDSSCRPTAYREERTAHQGICQELKVEANQELKSKSKLAGNAPQITNLGELTILHERLSHNLCDIAVRLQI